MAKIGALHKTYSKVKPGKRSPKQLPVITKKKKPLKSETKNDTDDNTIENSTVGSLLKNPFKQSTLVDPEQVQKGIFALQTIVKKKEENEQKLFNEDKAIFLQIVCMKVPQTPPRFIRILLPNTPYSAQSDICLIVSDHVTRGPKDDEEAVHFYKNLLSQNDVSNIKTIIPIHQLSTEYDTYESKRRLVDLYDVFLVEGKIAGKVTHILGKVFVSKRKCPTAIKIQGVNICAQISCALNKSLLHIHSKGDSFTMQIGNTSMSDENLKENVIAAAEGLANEFPGGWENISTLYLKTSTSMSIPIYVNLKNKNEVKTPIVRAKRPKAYESVTDEITTFEDAKILVHPGGKVKLLRNEPPREPLLKKRKRGKRGARGKIHKQPVVNKEKPRRNVLDKSHENTLEKEEENYLLRLKRDDSKKIPKKTNIKIKKRKDN